MPPNTTLIGHDLSPDDLQTKIGAVYQQRLEELVIPWNKNIGIQAKVLIDIPFLEIIREVLRDRHNLVIKMVESSELLDRIFDSDNIHLLRKYPCPV
ncbi:MAG: hypothetical protein COB94_002840 [Gammaproteobacteria bacterium]|nr:hypothetical protein [Gammaproteobacteria bacterium]